MLTIHDANFVVRHAVIHQTSIDRETSTHNRIGAIAVEGVRQVEVPGRGKVGVFSRSSGGYSGWHQCVQLLDMMGGRVVLGACFDPLLDFIRHDTRMMLHIGAHFLNVTGSGTN